MYVLGCLHVKVLAKDRNKVTSIVHLASLGIPIVEHWSFLQVGAIMKRALHKINSAQIILLCPVMGLYVLTSTLPSTKLDVQDIIRVLPEQLSKREIQLYIAVIALHVQIM